MPFRRLTARLSLIGMLACADAPQPSPHVAAVDRTAVLIPDSQPIASGTEREPAAAESLQPPRRAFSARLLPLWSHLDSSDPDILLHPVDVRVTDLGVLVSDYGRHSIRAFDSRAGKLIKEWGRYGHGPLEFVNPPLVIGTAANPMAFDPQTGRAHWLRDTPPLTLYVDRARPWISGCLIADGQMLLAASPRPTGAAFATSTVGVRPVASDSIDHPISVLRAIGWFARQTALYQADDTTCVIAPGFHREFALMSRFNSVAVGSSIEELPLADMETARNGKSISYSMTRSARAGHRSAATWRNHVLILTEGTTALKRRLVDVYARVDLSYRGTILLPFAADRIAMRGDTLAIIGERDDALFLAVMLLTP